MFDVYPLDASSIRRCEPLYQSFVVQAQEDERWNIEMVDFGVLAQAVAQGQLGGYMLLHRVSQMPVGMMVYALEDHRAIEVNFIYFSPEISEKVAVDTLMKRFIEDITRRDDWEVVSYAMLGHQESLIRYITWYGFQPVGQAIVKYDFMDQLSIQVLQNFAAMQPPEGFQLAPWSAEYAGQSSEAIYDCFHTASDARWDPRFRTSVGSKSALNLITSGAMGEHHKNCTTLLLDTLQPQPNGQPRVAGFCFLVQASMLEGNIPLVGVRPEYQHQKFGLLMMKRTMIQAIQEMVEAKINMLAIHATLDTDNYSAIRMYRKLGFKEMHNYPHVYLTPERAKQVTPGQWCANPV